MTDKPTRGEMVKAVSYVLNLVEDAPEIINRLSELSEIYPDELVEAVGHVGFPTEVELNGLIVAVERCAYAIKKLNKGEDEFDDPDHLDYED